MLSYSSRLWILWKISTICLADLEAKQMVDVLVAHLDVLGLDRVKELLLDVAKRRGT